MSFSRWEERVGPAELERAVLSLLEFGQIAAAKQLQHKLSPVKVPSEILLVDAALKLAAMSTPSKKVSVAMLDEEVRSVIRSHHIPIDQHEVDTVQVCVQISLAHYTSVFFFVFFAFSSHAVLACLKDILDFYL